MNDEQFSTAAFSTLICDVPRPGVARITLNRPAQMNAYTFGMTQDLLAALALYRDDDSLRALILTGAGTRAFCTGGDLSGADADHNRKVATQPMGSGREMRDGMQAVVRALVRLDKPSLAVIRGYAVAGGLALALACDFRLAGEDAIFGGQAQETFAAMRDERFADIAAQTGAFGLAKQLEAQFARLLPASPAAKA